MHGYAILSCLASMLLACGAGGGPVGSAPDISYALERAMTGQTTNVLTFDYTEGTEYRFSLDGPGIAAGIPLGEYLPLQRQVDLSYAREGSYQLALAIVQADGTPYLQDSLGWTYSTKVPAAPIVSFTEAATSDTAVTMLIAGSREPDTKEIWVEGDLAGPHASGGFWDDLSASGIYLLTVTPDDGIKTMTVKLRNVYGNESAASSASILKKSTPPTGCDAVLAGSGSDSSTIRMQLLAVNDGPVFYNVFGDVAEVSDFQPFSSGDIVEVEVEGSPGTKNLSIVIRDLAGNTCETIERSLTLSSDYVRQSIAVDGAPYWTSQTSVALLLSYDHFPDAEPIEMRLTGSILGDTVGSWIPYQQKIAAQLTSAAGDKRISVQFRDKTLVESFVVSTRVYLNPSVSVATADDGSRSVVISRIIGASSHTITGCAEAYDGVDFSAAYPCTPSAGTISVTYLFEDESTLTLTATP